MLRSSGLPFRTPLEVVMSALCWLVLECCAACSQVWQPQGCAPALACCPGPAAGADRGASCDIYAVCQDLLQAGAISGSTMLQNGSQAGGLDLRDPLSVLLSGNKPSLCLQLV